MLQARSSRPDLADPALAARWRVLARHASAFLSWEWTSCLAVARFPDPVLIETFDGPSCVGLALFNRRRTRLGHSLHLHESGDPGWDSVFIEHNGVLAAPNLVQPVMAATLRCALRLASRVVLSGIDDAGLAAVQGIGWVGRRQTRLAPFRALAPQGALLPELSRNTRAQLRRSDRAYGAPLLVEQAETVAQGLDWLDRLLALHVATWRARGIDSGFAAEPVQHFHRALIRGSGPGGPVQMLRVRAGDRVVGYLLNLVANGRVGAYQGGFDYAAAGPHGKPGLSCHAAAIEHARAAGATEYDFLAGDGRYKRSLADQVRALHWVELCRPLSAAGLAAAARRMLRR